MLQLAFDRGTLQFARRRIDGSGLTARGRGRAIIEAVLSVNASFMVMGAFGDNQFDALLGLGRTTRTLATAAPVPLLLQS